MTARRTLVPLVLALACGFDQSNAVALDPAPGVPVALENVRMAELLSARLGAGTTRFSSSDGPNAIGVAYDVKVVAPAPDHAGVSAQLTCMVGEHAVTTVLAMDGSDRLASAPVGTKLEQRDTFPPNPFLDEIPKVCETTLYYTIAPPLPAHAVPPYPEPHREAIGTVCFVDDELSAGTCDRGRLPRTPAEAPIAVSRVVGRIGAMQGGGHGVQVSVLATAGERVPQDFRIVAEATCKVGEETLAIPLSLMLTRRHARPGESFWDEGVTMPGGAMAEEPSACTVEVSLAKGGTRTLLAEACVRGEATSDGRCA